MHFSFFPNSVKPYAIIVKQVGCQIEDGAAEGRLGTDIQSKEYKKHVTRNMESPDSGSTGMA